ncbi:hypothetical protein CFOL_v3_14858 [Cephalotus follicularis]|uniref:UBN2 domain-containing protein n=1 Tax=Cephalotus follicularis TaxID=3775 RepID=A0A1Q3BTU1_CEPFO|nr:hypothetical protein CFOL_v3_14858 [Cephalotus follicularis]
MRLQLLENELRSVTQRDMTINPSFAKIKSLCREISELDPASKTIDERMIRIIIHMLRPEYKSFITAVRVASPTICRRSRKFIGLPRNTSKINGWCFTQK